MAYGAMATDIESTETAVPDQEASMDGGLCRLQLPGLADLDEDEVVAPRHAAAEDER
jgi:hypothetical protein